MVVFLAMKGGDTFSGSARLRTCFLSGSGLVALLDAVQQLQQLSADVGHHFPQQAHVSDALPEVQRLLCGGRTEPLNHNSAKDWRCAGGSQWRALSLSLALT